MTSHTIKCDDLRLYSVALLSCTDPVIEVQVYAVGEAGWSQNAIKNSLCMCATEEEKRTV